MSQPQGYNTRASSKLTQKASKNSDDKPKSLKGKGTFHPRLYRKGTSWSLDTISRDTLILGDSNLRIMSEEPPNDVQVEAYPGAKVHNVKTLFEKYPNYAPKPSNIVLNIGLNDHPNKPGNTRVQLRGMTRVLRKKFPNSKIYIQEINAPQNLKLNGTQNLETFNNFLPNINLEVIPKLNDTDFELNSDNYHWNKPTAKKYLNRWMEHLNF